MPDELPAAESLQFRRAERLADQCKSCQEPITSDYYRAREHVICPSCAQRMQVGLQAPPAQSLLRAALYGTGAALAGCALYALVAIVLHLEIGLIAVVVGFMVGKAVRYGSRGLGGRPQQILAVTLTYFGITTSFIPIFLYTVYKTPIIVQQAVQPRLDRTPEQAVEQPRTVSIWERMTTSRVVFVMARLALVAPFLAVYRNPVSGLISLFILLIGLQRAWALTGRPQLQIVGPFKLSQA